MRAHVHTCATVMLRVVLSTCREPAFTKARWLPASLVMFFRVPQKYTRGSNRLLPARTVTRRCASLALFARVLQRKHKELKQVDACATHQEARTALHQALEQLLLQTCTHACACTCTQKHAPAHPQGRGEAIACMSTPARALPHSTSSGALLCIHRWDMPSLWPGEGPTGAGTAAHRHPE